MKDWAFYPDPAEQLALTSLEAEALIDALLANSKDGKLAVVAAYDLLYAAEDAEKAEKLLQVLTTRKTTEEITSAINTALTMRIYADKAPREEQEQFKALCEKVLGVPIAYPELNQQQSDMARIIGIANENGADVIFL